jgi:hypothetical protein
MSLQPWLEKETPLLPHQESAILIEYARDGTTNDAQLFVGR